MSDDVHSGDEPTAIAGDEVPTVSVPEAPVVRRKHPGMVRRSLPPDIITMEIEVDKPPAAGPHTVGVDGVQGPPAPAKVRRRLGRFTVVGTLGRGGMGTVLEAYDDTLARTVALKLLHGRVVESRRERLLREAQALAQLSHPNVVQVYEVGLVEDQMFIAMELVHGMNLRKWQRRRRHWREVVEVYLQAGRGLAAAHAEELIHRDFKPENCIISPEGRVCVLDFGLARGSKTIDESIPNSTFSVDEISLRQRLTQSGKVLGTLSYLPLQQLVGRPADPKSDQFSFCVSLYEALYGMLPFCDRSVMTLMEAQREERLQPVPRRSGVPRRLRKILLRGLAKRPRERWPTMNELLAELERLLRPRRWTSVAAVGALVVAGFAAGATAGVADAPCEDVRSELDGVWDGEARSAVEGAFERSGHVDAPRLFERVDGELERYAEEWVGLREQSCRAKLEATPPLEAAVDLSAQCMLRQRRRLKATVQALAEISTPSEALDRTVLPFKLPALARCGDPEAVEAELALPDDLDERSRIVELQTELERAVTLSEAGAMDAATDVARIVVEGARRLDYSPLLARGLRVLGRLQSMSAQGSDAERSLQEAILVAARVGDDVTAARAWTFLIHAVMVQGDVDRALSLRFAATAAVDRSHDEVARAWLLNNLGILYGHNEDFEAARSYLHRALAVKQSTLGREHFDVGIAWFNLGNALLGEERSVEARQAFERAQAIFERTVGESHPYVAFVETGQGHLMAAEGRLSQAVRHHRKALDIRERALGADDLHVAKSLEHLARLLVQQGGLGEAADDLRRAQLIYERALGADAAQVGVCMIGRSDVNRRLDRPGEARSLAEQAVELLEATGDPSEQALARFALARALPEDAAGRSRARALVTGAVGRLRPDVRAEAEAWMVAHPEL